MTFGLCPEGIRPTRSHDFNLEFPALKVVSHNYIVLHVYAIFQVPLYYTYNRVIAKTEFEVIRTRAL